MLNPLLTYIRRLTEIDKRFFHVKYFTFQKSLEVRMCKIVFGLINFN
jgi:hypothetical protein